MRKFYSIIVLLTVLFVSCKSPAKLYDRGNYNDAMDAAIKKLQKDPYDYDSREVLKSSYKYAVSEYEDRIRILAAGSSESKNDQIYLQYDQLQNLYEKIRRYPAIVQFMKPVDYSSFVETYRNKAHEDHITRGDKWMEGEDRRSFREAYQEYRKALRYIPYSFTTESLL